MAIQLSPGVSVTEVDLTTVVPSVSTSTGAFVGNFEWGPANVRVTVDSENTLASVFGTPNSNTYVDFFTAASFLAYSNDLRTVRAINASTTTATANAAATVQIANEDVYETTYLQGNNGDSYGAFAARYAGAVGNAIQVDIYDDAFSSTFANTYITSGGISRAWSSVVNGAPGTSSYVSAAGGSDDEFHVVVTDSTGAITGTKGSVLEVFPYVSKAIDAIDGNNQTTYWKNVIYTNSNFIYGMDPVDYANTSATWGDPAAGTTFARTPLPNTQINLVNGVTTAITDANLQTGYDLFANPDVVDVSLVLTGDASVTVQQYVIDNIVTAAGSATGRSGDAVAFISPRYTDVVNQSGNETTNIKNWLESLARSSSYVVTDSGWKYMYDKYNGVYRYIPLNGDIAGLCAFTDQVRDPWYSPAGFNRGAVKNAVKLSWNPNQSQRDILYPLGVNPVVTFPGQGTVLYGDKTLQNKPSAFDRINVRRLFIVLEKAISRAAKFSLFEFNDDFTRAQFVALVAPFLRDVQGRRGIYDFRVVCDTTNNTPQVIDNNQFVGDIYIKPARSINFIRLNFIAVGTGVQFTEVTGAI
jgi:phage tail sheath protein FI